MTVKRDRVYVIFLTVQSLAFLSQLNHWQIDLATFGILLASAVITIVPEELIFITLGFLAHYERVHPLEAILAAKLGLLCADALTVWFGRVLGHKVIHRKPFCFLFGRDSIHRSLEKLRTSGNSVLFFARFLPMLRAPVFLAAGISGFSLRRSVIIDLFAAAIQVTGFFMLGYVFGEGVAKFVTLFSYAIPVAIVGFFTLSMIKVTLQSRRNQSSALVIDVLPKTERIAVRSSESLSAAG